MPGTMHYGWVPYGQANVASYQHLIQIASCSFNEVAIQLGGVFLSDWNNKPGLHICVGICVTFDVEYAENRHVTRDMDTQGN